MAALLFCGGTLRAQSIAISPSYPGVKVGTSVQLTARVTGLATTAVTWKVNGIVGGNSTVGTIGTSGLYTAPATVPAMALVSAVSAANAAIIGADYMNVLTAGPVITSVTPNPVLTGNFSVTIQGTGFLAGAKATQNYGTANAAALTTTNVTATSVTATGYQGSASSVSFVVQNPGSVPSNVLSVPVQVGYRLTVTGGTGSGVYAAGTTVTLTANTPPAGEVFQGWMGATVASAASAATTLKMPAAAVTVTANFARTYPLTVVNGTGSGSYVAGTVVSISANAPPSGEAFKNWTGATVGNAQSAQTQIDMPAASTAVTANFAPLYRLTVVNGTGSGSYLAGAVVPIKANTPAAGQAFVDWTGATVANANVPSTTIAMPSGNATVTANYATEYTLAVSGGTGSGSYAAGSVVAITANAPAAGQAFLDWTGATVGNASAASTTIAMPSQNTSVTANYAAKPPASCAGMSLGVNASLNGFVPFPSTSAWNTDISSAPVDPNSASITSVPGFAGLHLHHDFSSVAGGNYGIPYMVVDSSSTPVVPINVIDYADQSDVAAAPYPSTAPIEGAPADCSGWPDVYVGDSHVLVVDRNGCMLYETYNTHRCKGAWNASSETIWDIKNYEQRPWGWTSADAAGLPIFPGLVRYDEVASGAIDHAIRFTMQSTKNDANGGYFVEPASHAAGVYWGVENVMGMRIRLKASFDISKFSPANQVILTAMKKYGMILADNGGYFYFQGVPDPRWDDNDLVALDGVLSSNFEVVQMTPAYPGYDTATAPTGKPPVINSFAASASSVSAGTPVTLTWSTTNDSYDFIDKLGGVRGGSVTIKPTATTTYTLNATNQYGRSTMQVTVTVK
jgi:hypothetical protein